MNVYKSLFRKIAASVAVIFSLLTIVEGSQVLLGLTQQEYIVFTPLLVYNILMGIVGFICGFVLWLNYKKAIMPIRFIVITHIIVLLIIGVIYLTSNVVAMHSVQAMSIRVVIWLIISLVTFRTDKQKEDYLISRS